MRFCKPSLVAPAYCCWRRWRRLPGPTSLPSAYDSAWETPLTIRLGDARPHLDPARVGQQRLDDLLLFRGRAGGTPGVRPWRAATATSGHAPGAGGHRGHDRAGRDLPGPERRPGLRRRLGGDDVHRHRLRPRAAGAGGAWTPRSGPDLPAHRGRGGRSRGPTGDRDCLQRPGCARSAATGARHPRRNTAATPRPYPLRAALLPARRRSVGRTAGLGDRAGRDRSCARAPHLGVRAQAR